MRSFYQIIYISLNKPVILLFQVVQIFVYHQQTTLLNLKLLYCYALQNKIRDTINTVFLDLVVCQDFFTSKTYIYINKPMVNIHFKLTVNTICCLKLMNTSQRLGLCCCNLIKMSVFCPGCISAYFSRYSSISWTEIP